MPRHILVILLTISVVQCCFAAQPPASRAVDLTAADGTKLKATYFSSGKPGPGVLLMHQCNRDRKMWDTFAPKLAAAGFNVLTLDFRGFGESGGIPANKATQQQANEQFQKFPDDVDVAFNFLVSQPDVKRDLIGAGGASCGVNQSVQLARRHPEVKSLMLLSGPSNIDGRRFLKQSSIAILGAGADDDEFKGSLEQTEWLTGLSSNPGNRFIHYKDGGHGIEMFAPHPELADLILDWYTTTLIKTPGRAPADKKFSVRHPNILEQIDEPGGAAKLQEQLKADARPAMIPEQAANIVGYEHMQSGDHEGAIDIFKLIVATYPNSPNAYDSLADGYAAAGQRVLAKQNAQKAIELLATDKTETEDRKKLIRESAEQKLRD